MSKKDFDDKQKKINKKNTSNKAKQVLVENGFKKLQTIESSLFIGQNYFNNDGAQLDLIFQPIYKTITIFSGLPNIISEWESKGLLNEICRPPYTTNKILSPKLQWDKSRLRLRFEGSCLKKIRYNTYYSKQCGKFIYCLLIRYMVTRFKCWFYSKILLVWSVKITKNADTDQYSYSGCVIGFDSQSLFSISNFDLGKNVVIFELDINLSVYIDNKGKDTLILAKGPTQGLTLFPLGAAQSARATFNFLSLWQFFVFFLDFLGEFLKFILVLDFNWKNLKNFGCGQFLRWDQKTRKKIFFFLICKINYI